MVEDTTFELIQGGCASEEPAPSKLQTGVDREKLYATYNNVLGQGASLARQLGCSEERADEIAEQVLIRQVGNSGPLVNMDAYLEQVRLECPASAEVHLKSTSFLDSDGYRALRVTLIREHLREPVTEVDALLASAVSFLEGRHIPLTPEEVGKSVRRSFMSRLF